MSCQIVDTDEIMSIQTYRHQLQALRQALQQLQSAVSRGGEGVQARTDEGVDVQCQFREAQQQFQQLVAIDISPEIMSQIAHLQPLQTEMNKQLRLLGIDVAFLQTARQSATSHQRQVQMGDRLLLLIQYCDRLLS